MKVLVSQSCLTICYAMDCSPPSSSVHGILQARILEWDAISFSKGSFWSGDRTPVSCTADKFFTSWATGEVILIWTKLFISLPLKKKFGKVISLQLI